jgi:hypothetical protein
VEDKIKRQMKRRHLLSSQNNLENHTFPLELKVEEEFTKILPIVQLLLKIPTENPIIFFVCMCTNEEKRDFSVAFLIG